MNTIHLEPNQVPAYLRGSYNGRKFKAVVTETVTIPSDAGVWGGGSRDLYSYVMLQPDADPIRLTGQNAAPWDRSRRSYERSCRRTSSDPTK
jgi:hypothetical protein